MGLILIAYERESEQAALEKLLSPRGHRIVKASNGLEALDAARREPPHVVVSDIVLPRMDGFALCRKWKQDERLQNVPFVFYTRRHDDPKYERFALELGAERFLSRNEQPETLLQIIDELLAKIPAGSTPAAPARASRQDEGSGQRSDALERTQQALALATERAQQAQTRLRNQIGELEGTNQRLASGEARFRRIFEANAFPMWISDQATGGFIAVNEAALETYGYTRAEFLALKAASLADNTATAEPGLVRHRRKDGSTLEGAIASRPIEFDGRTADIVTLCDLSERVIAHRKQIETANADRSLIEALVDGCWILDSEGRIVDANSAYCKMSGYSREELLKMSAADIEQQGAGTRTGRVRLAAANLDRYEVAHKRRDGSSFDAEVSVGQLRSSRGDAILIVRDVSQRQRELAAQRIEQRQLEFMLDLFRQAEAFDESAIVRRMLDQAVEITNSPVAYLFFVQPADKTISLVGWRDRARAHTTLTSGEPHALNRVPLFADSARTRQPTSSNDLEWKPQVDGLPDLQRFVAVPVIADDATVAILGVANREAAYGENDQKLLGAMSEGVWRVLQSKRSYAQTLASLQRSDVANQGMIDALLALSERHDPYTAGSARKVAALAVALGREAGLDGERQHALRVAALLHDVGNIAVPAAVLAKPGALNEAETALMRSHVEEGCKLLANIDFGAPVAEIIFEHHERVDGSGYPRGMKGEEILLEARILAIADVVEAMSSNRPHRPALGMDAAIEEINRGAGIQYDLHLATACTRLVRQHGFRFPS
jgi:PAS domain S-box-containing protein/putative nucleotidyltransferase with HDIG domain